MKLKDWLKKKKKSVLSFSEELEISRNHLNGIVNGWRRPSPKLAKKIEELTKGKVKKEELVFYE